jgi:hypothetical protein
MFPLLDKAFTLWKIYRNNIKFIPNDDAEAIGDSPNLGEGLYAIPGVTAGGQHHQVVSGQ